MSTEVSRKRDYALSSETFARLRDQLEEESRDRVKRDLPDWLKSLVGAELLSQIEQHLQNWLNQNLISSAQGYMKLRAALVRRFEFLENSCPAGDLADETINRIAVKIADGDPVRNLTSYAMAVAKYVFLEWRKKSSRENSPDGDDDSNMNDAFDIAVFRDKVPDDNIDSIIKEIRSECLSHCMSRLKDSDRFLIIEYYSGEHNATHRKELAKQFEMTANSLFVDVCRIRKSLSQCVPECVESKQSQLITG